MERSIIINVISPDLISPTPGLLLNLFYTEIYEQHNPNHQRGKTKLTKQKNKIVDYLISSIGFLVKYQKLSSFLKRLCRRKYQEGKLINNCDW